MAEPRRFLAIHVGPWGLAGACVALAGLATVAGFFGAAWWPLDLAAHFRVQYLGISGAVTIACAASRRFAAAAGAGMVFLANAWVVLPFALATPAHREGGRALRVILANVNTYRGDVDRVRAFVKDGDPDVLVLEEVNQDWVNALASIREKLPVSVVRVRDDNFGIGLWTRIPPRRAEVVDLGPAGVPSIAAELPIDGACVGLLATHPVPPGGREMTAWRDRQLEAAGSAVAHQAIPWVLLGDLNVTPWSSPYRKLVASVPLSNAMRGRGLHGTWPCGLPPLRIAIDHCLATPGVRIATARVGPDVGSDHFPLIVDIGLDTGSAHATAAR